MGQVTRQLVAAGTSMAANYRACCRARSRPEFNAKLGVAAEEADETVFWIQMLIESGTATGRHASTMLDEARQLRAIIAASAKTARRNYQLDKSNTQLRNSINKSRNQEIKK